MKDVEWPAIAMALIGLAACGSSSGNAPDAGGAPPDTAPPIVELGMNDITMLLPLPAAVDQPVLIGIGGDGAGKELVPPELFDQIKMRGNMGMDYTHVQVVAVRFDLCHRDSGGTCPSGDAELRLVMQEIGVSLSNNIVGQDRTAHALYRIPAAEVRSVIDQLGALAQLAAVPVTSPLMINTAVTTNPAYHDQLRALVASYARGDRLTQLAMENGPDNSGFAVWDFAGDSIVSSQLVALTRDELFLLGGMFPEFDDVPPGFRLAFDSLAFRAATPADQTTALELLAAIQNPELMGQSNVRCLGCHLATGFDQDDMMHTTVDPSTITNRYMTSYDVSIAAINGGGGHVGLVRGLGYVMNRPAISQRAANETAHVLGEIAARFPPTH